MTVGWLWKSTGWYIVPTSARDVLTTLAAIGGHSATQRFAWRGMSSVDYDLSSSLQRILPSPPPLTEAVLRHAELQILQRARAWGLGAQPVGAVDDLQLLADLQHYGIQTRLIDVTSNPTTALWFACQPPKTDGASKSGVLVAINTTGWDVHQTIDATGRSTWGQLRDPTGNRLDLALKTGRPFRVEAAIPNDRLRAQEGFFLAGALPEPPANGEVHWTTPFSGLPVPFRPGDPEQLTDDLIGTRARGAPRNMPFVAVVISSNVKQKLLRILEGTYNRRAKVLFPDFAGFLDFDGYPAHLADHAPVSAPPPEEMLTPSSVPAEQDD